MRNRFILLISTLPSLLAGISVGVLISHHGSIGSHVVSKAPLIVEFGDDPLRTVRPASCETFTRRDGTNGVRIRGEVLRNDGTDALIVKAELRFFGGSDALSSVRREWRVPVGSTVTDLEFDAGFPTRATPPSLTKCLLFIDSTKRAEFRVNDKVAHLVPDPTPTALGECN